MELHYFEWAEGLAVVETLASDGVPFEFIPRKNRAEQFDGKPERITCAIKLPHLYAERNRIMLITHGAE